MLVFMIVASDCPVANDKQTKYIMMVVITKLYMYMCRTIPVHLSRFSVLYTEKAELGFRMSLRTGLYKSINLRDSSQLLIIDHKFSVCMYIYLQRQSLYDC